MKQTYLYGAMAVGLLFASCSSSDPIPNEDKILDNNQAYFVSVRISGDVPDTRAGVDDGTPTGTDFGNGSGYESTVSNVYFVFYDNDGNVIGDVTPVDDMKSDGWKTDVSTDAIEKYYKSVVKVNVMKGEKQPTQVICYINPVNPGNLNVPLRDIQTLQLETAVKGSDESLRFPMSNSVYYPYDNNTTTVNPNATPIIAVPLVMNVNLFTKEGDAEAANEKGECAEIYVERYASKLAFDATTANQIDFETGQRVWNTDGTEKATPNKIRLHFNPLHPKFGVMA